ncbi:MAG: hypothetical protein EP298_02285 [Gammaproteobacteria bacterium]|nr:MAG: hypothetical protein EP298_02285 [Gammaproteobacteria bacterium]UTW43634.1 hypothetical protein KFE69_05970 [bacterium SCSIO 12844]
MGPSGSTLLTSFHNAKDLTSMRTFGQWTREGNQVKQIIWKSAGGKLSQEMKKHDKADFTDPKTNIKKTYDTIQSDKKFNNSNHTTRQ